jgi:hypothetical protein
MAADIDGFRPVEPVVEAWDRGQFGDIGHLNAKGDARFRESYGARLKGRGADRAIRGKSGQK